MPLIKPSTASSPLTPFSYGSLVSSVWYNYVDFNFPTLVVLGANNTLTGNNTFSAANTFSGDNVFTATNFFEANQVFTNSTYLQWEAYTSGYINVLTVSGSTNLITLGDVANSNNINIECGTGSAPEANFLSGSSTGLSIVPIPTGLTQINCASSATGFLIQQNSTGVNSATGATLYIQAQQCTGTTTVGGSLVLTSGSGTTAGNLLLQSGSATKVSITPNNVQLSAPIGGTSTLPFTFASGTLVVAGASISVGNYNFITVITGTVSAAITLFFPNTINAFILDMSAVIFDGTITIECGVHIGSTITTQGVYFVYYNGAVPPVVFTM